MGRLAPAAAHAEVRGRRRHPRRDPRPARRPSGAKGRPLSDDPRAALADALGDLAATLRFHRDLGLEHLELEGEYLKSPADALRAQEQALQGCRRCKLCEGRNTIVFGSGNPQAELVVIGEGPGADEDAQGLPFVGRAGQLLTRMLASVDVTREEVFITNTVLCRPPGNRNPEADELAACAPFLADKLAVIQPKVILTLGSVATQAMLHTKEPIGKLRGRLHQYGEAVLIPTFHPAFLLRNPGQDYKRMAWDDLKLAKREYDARRTRDR
ncbi:MAG TPA: uracil-DNA glycosylase [Methylomirabilota bacterium]